jgi:CheY-like chemotaxis protein
MIRTSDGVVLTVDMKRGCWEPRDRTSARAQDRSTGKLNGASRPASPLVLVVDDEQPVRYAVRDALNLECYIVETAANGAEALEKLQTQKPSAIVLDLMMPVMDGWHSSKHAAARPIAPGFRFWSSPRRTDCEKVPRACTRWA